jgi:hypothetical protein
MAAPLLDVLAEFIHGGNAVPAARTAAVTTLFFSLWQLCGSGMTKRMPSLVLIHSHDGEGTSPLDSLAASLVFKGNFQEPQTYQVGMFAGGTPKMAPTFMTRAINRMEECSKQVRVPLMAGPQLQEGQFYAAQRTGFGCGGSRPYNGSWDDTFGLITERNCEVILRLNTPEDRDKFRKHVMSDPEKLRAAIGYGPSLTVVSKRLCISGALQLSEWDEKFASHALGLGLPLVFLPEPKRKTAIDSSHPAFGYMASQLRTVFTNALEEPANFVPGPWFSHYAQCLRDKLRPLPGDYEFLMQRMARQLFPVSWHLASWAGNRSGASAKESEAIALDLCAHALRGLVISVAGLSWHGFGLDGDIPQQDVIPVLNRIRAGGPMSRSDVARSNRISKETRDELLKRFAAEDLVKIDGKVVAATTYAEFVEALYARKEFPELPNYWKATAAKAKA